MTITITNKFKICSDKYHHVSDNTFYFLKDKGIFCPVFKRVKETLTKAWENLEQQCRKFPFEF